MVGLYHRTQANALKCSMEPRLSAFPSFFPFDENTHARAHIHSEFTYKQADESNRKIG